MRLSSHQSQGVARLDPLVWRISGVVMLGPLMTSLDSTVVNVSLDHLGRDLHASLTSIQWVSSAYLLALALMLPLSGWLVDRVGAKRVYLGCFTRSRLPPRSAAWPTRRASSSRARAARHVGWAPRAHGPDDDGAHRRAPGGARARHHGHAGAHRSHPRAGPRRRDPAARELALDLLRQSPRRCARPRAGAVDPAADGHETSPRSFDALGFVLLSPGLVFLLHGCERLGSGGGVTGGNVLELVAAVTLLAALHGMRWGSVGSRSSISGSLRERPSPRRRGRSSCRTRSCTAARCCYRSSSSACAVARRPRLDCCSCRSASG